MRALVTLCLLALCLGAASCQRVDIRNVDTFDVGTMSIVIPLTSDLTTNNAPIRQSSFYSSGDPNSEDILGGERDLQLTVNSGASSQVFSTSVIDGAWEASTPTARTGLPPPLSKIVIQYDGFDNSTDVNTLGLGGQSGLDITYSGTADGFRLEYESDFATEYLFEIYDVQGRVSRRTAPAAAGTNLSLTVLYSQFTGNADFEAVGAIVVTIDGKTNVDIVTEIFAISGPLASPSPSNTRTPSRTRTPSTSPRAPSASRSNSPAPQEPSSSRTPSATRSPPIPPSESRTPSRSASPSPFPTCRCHCPHFRCGVVYDVPDSDDDDEASSERIIYRPVFYYAANNDFDDVEGDNDGQTTWFAFSRKVAEFKPGQHDVPVYLYLSGANTITTSIALVLLSLLALVF